MAVDTIDPARAGQRRRFIEQALERLELPEPEARALEDGQGRALLQLASAPTDQASEHPAARGPEFLAINGAGDPELDGLYTSMPLARISDLDMRILEKALVADEDGEETRLRLVIRRRGREHAVEMSAAEFASNGRLRASLYVAPLPGAT